MYSDTFFMLLHQGGKNLVTSQSDTEVEHLIYLALKSDKMESFRQRYISEDLEFPRVILTNCPILHKNLGLLTPNNAVRFSPRQQSLTVCKNYLRAPQQLREELAREVTLAYRYRDWSEAGDEASLQSQLTRFAGSSLGACRNELDASLAQRTDVFDEKTKQAVILRCANLQFKHRFKDFLTKEDLMRTQAEEGYFEPSSWHETAREFIATNSHCSHNKSPFN